MKFTVMSKSLANVREETFFHLSPAGSLCEGQLLTTGSQSNRLWTRIHRSDHMHANLATGRMISADAMIRHAIAVYKTNAPRADSGYHYDPLETLDEASAMLMQALICIRELVFENVRCESYARAPSRRRCIWLIPNMEGCLRTWAKAYSTKRYDVLKVKATGNIWYANARYAEGGTMSLKSWERLAHRYWSGDRVGEPSTEAIFEGELEVLECLSSQWVQDTCGTPYKPASQTS